MARDRLAGMGGRVQPQYGDQVAPQPTYPPPANGVNGGNGRAPNPYAQAGGNGGYAQGGQAGNPYANQYGQQEQYAMGGVGGAPGAGGDFWSELSAAQSMLSELQERIQAVRSVHQQSLAATDGNAAAQADQLNNDARALRERCKNQIKKLYKLAKGDRAMKQQVEAVKTRFTGLLNEHQVVEQEFRKKVKDRAERQFRIVKPDATPEEVREVTESDNPQVFSQALLNSNRYGAARGAYREVQERHAEIQKIEKTLTELAQMFNEMAMLVDQQDEVIVNVEGQAQGVDRDVKEGLVQTQKAVDSARAARRKKWICFWICVLIVVILAAVLGGIFGSRANQH